MAQINKVESQWQEDYVVNRNIIRRDGGVSKSSIKIDAGKLRNDLTGFPFDYYWLRSKIKSDKIDNSKTLNLVDLFCGTGPMTLGVKEACNALNIDLNPILAIDFEKTSALNYALNYPNCNVIQDDISKLIDGNFGEKITDKETEIINSLPVVDFLIGGPPCQGHSDLNNHTRRDDPKNQLILKVVRFAELTNPKYIIIENVQGIRHDKNNVLEKAKKYLTKLNYYIKETVLVASNFGVAQKRKRYFLIATKEEIQIDFNQYEISNPNTFEWACDDLVGLKSDDIYDSSSIHSTTNKKRIEYLFKHDLHELPDSERPKCHQNGNHSYNSVYGRMYYNQPSPTITGGFGSIGQGRFCHPKEKRSITPHEACRLQFIPDFFKFHHSISRVAMQKLIGNAVPPKLTYIISLELLR